MIEVKDLTVGFEGKYVLNGFNLRIREGETIGLLGQSGEGKTVFLKTLVGLIKPESGQLIIDGVKMNQIKRRELFSIRKKFGFVFQHSALFDSLTVLENITLPMIETGISSKEAEKKAIEALRLVDMSPFVGKHPAELSGGMKKRVAIARALVTKPKYLLYDEPTTGLDPLIGDKINDLIVELKVKSGATGIVVTHDLRSALKVSDRIVLLHKGKIVVESATSEILNVEHPILREFLLSSGLYIPPIQR